MGFIMDKEKKHGQILQNIKDGIKTGNATETVKVKNQET